MFQAARELSLLHLTCSVLLQRLKNLVMLENVTALRGKKASASRTRFKKSLVKHQSPQETVTFLYYEPKAI